MLTKVLLHSRSRSWTAMVTSRYTQVAMLTVLAILYLQNLLMEPWTLTASLTWNLSGLENSKWIKELTSLWELPLRTLRENLYLLNGTSMELLSKKLPPWWTPLKALDPTLKSKLTFLGTKLPHQETVDPKLSLTFLSTPMLRNPLPIIMNGTLSLVLLIHYVLVLPQILPPQEQLALMTLTRKQLNSPTQVLVTKRCTTWSPLKTSGVLVNSPSPTVKLTKPKNPIESPNSKLTILDQSDSPGLLPQEMVQLFLKPHTISRFWRKMEFLLLKPTGSLPLKDV